ncbi:MAG: pseudouridine synthase [Pseudomonadota bacterium]
MTDAPSRSGDRIAKVIARAGLASRRDAEKMVTDGRVTLNGKPVSNVAQNVGPGDRVTVDGKPLPEAEGARVWLYNKPVGLVVSEKDEEGRDTVFDALRPTLGRVLSVGRLDLNSEGLLLLTNDGGLKRRLELPATGWLRRYRVRVNGNPDEGALQRLRDGIAVDDDTGQDTFAPMQVTLDRQQGANAWLTVGLREGRNREIRRAMAALELYVNRLIRVSYGPFQLGTLGSGAVEEVRPRVLADQLGGLWDGDLAEAKREIGAGRDGAGKTRGRNPRPSGDRLVQKGRGAARSEGPKEGGAKPRGKPAPDRAARPDRPRTVKPPVTRNDGPGRPSAKGAPTAGDDTMRDRRGERAETKQAKADRKAEMRADPSVSLRKGGQRGRGFTKKKAPKRPKG